MKINFQPRLMRSWIAAGVAVVGAGVSVYKTIKSAKDKKKAEAAAARLREPNYKVQQEYDENRNLALANAGQGYTSSAKNFLTTQAEQGLGTAISAVGQSGGGVNDISKLYSTYLKSIDSTAANDSQLQLGNIQALMNQNKELASQKTIGWSLNEDRPYQTARKESRMDQQIADGNMWDGINGIVGSASAFGTAMQNKQLIDATKNNKNRGGGNDFYVSNQPAQPISLFQPSNPVMQNRSSPNVSMNDNYFANSSAGGGGYYPGSTDNNWSNALGLDYQ